MNKGIVRTASFAPPCNGPYDTTTARAPLNKTMNAACAIVVIKQYWNAMLGMSIVLFGDTLILLILFLITLIKNFRDDPTDVSGKTKNTGG